MRDNIDILSRSISKSIDLCKLNLDVGRWQRILFSGLVVRLQNTAYYKFGIQNMKPLCDMVGSKILLLFNYTACDEHLNENTFL